MIPSVVACMVGGKWRNFGQNLKIMLQVGYNSSLQLLVCTLTLRYIIVVSCFTDSWSVNDWDISTPNFTSEWSMAAIKKSCGTWRLVGLS